MNTDFRLAINFPSHPKLTRLRRRLGGDGAFGWVCLLAHVAANHPDGWLSGMDTEEIAIAGQYPDDAATFVKTLTEVHLIDEVDGRLRIHDWDDWNPWASGHSRRVAQARKGGRNRWSGISPEERSQQMREIRGHSGQTPSGGQVHDEPPTSYTSSNDEPPTSSFPSPSHEESMLEDEDLARSIDPPPPIAPPAGGAPALGNCEKKPDAKPKSVVRLAGKHRLPKDFTLRPALKAYAYGLKLDPQKVFDAFCDYWRASGGTKLDWDAAFRTWCRKESERLARVAPRPDARGLAPDDRPAPPSAESIVAQWRGQQ